MDGGGGARQTPGRHESDSASEIPKARSWGYAPLAIELGVFGFGLVRRNTVAAQDSICRIRVIEDEEVKVNARIS